MTPDKPNPASQSAEPEGRAVLDNLVTALLLGLVLVMEPKEADIMSRPPRDPARPLLTPSRCSCAPDW